MKNIALVSALGAVCLLACSGSDPAADAPATETDGGADPRRDTTVTTDPSCPKKAEVDDLDTNGTDDNCDGIDGMLNDTVFVVGGASDDGKGDPTSPVGSIAKAAEVAKATGKHHVYVCIGTLVESAALTAPADLHVHGGFACDRNWRRLDADSRTAWVSPSASALRIDGGTKVSFDHFDISAGAAVEPGQSSVAVTLHQVTEAELTDVTVSAGNGAPGAAGVGGGPSLPARGASANGNLVGFPGYGAEAVQQDCTLPGGAANRAGAGGAADPRLRRVGDSGGSSSDGTDGGDWRIVQNGDLFPLSSAYAVGSAGANGQPGASATATAALLGIVVDGRYVPTAGVGGGAGGDGRSGGGGAPGQGAEICRGYRNQFAAWTCEGEVLVRGGGGGGAGGCYGAGGAPGGGGQSGGASIAVLAQGGTLQLKRATLRSAAGGNGGASGEGTAGQIGGSPGAGGAGSRWHEEYENLRQPTSGGQVFGMPGFAGGKGGNGGNGGAGAAGAGGPTVGIFTAGCTATVDDTVRYELGLGGGGGAGTAGVPAGPAGLAKELVEQ